MPTTLNDTYLDIGHSKGTKAILWSMAMDHTVVSFATDRPERDGHHQFAGYDLTDAASSYAMSLRKTTKSKAWCDKYWKNSIASGRIDMETGRGSICSTSINSRRLDRFVVPALERHFWQRYSTKVHDWWIESGTNALGDDRWYYRGAGDPTGGVLVGSVPPDESVIGPGPAMHQNPAGRD